MRATLNSTWVEAKPGSDVAALPHETGWIEHKDINMYNFFGK